jgi:hypothetical protein
VSLPRSLAGATVIIEQLNDTELRIWKASIVPEDELVFREEQPTVLATEARDRSPRAARPSAQAKRDVAEGGPAARQMTWRNGASNRSVVPASAMRLSAGSPLSTIPSGEAPPSTRSEISVEPMSQ